MEKKMDEVSEKPSSGRPDLAASQARRAFLRRSMMTVLGLLAISTESDAASDPKWLAQVKALDELRFVGVDGAPVKLADFHQSVLMLNLWAHWCPNCIAEFSSMDRLRRTVGLDKMNVILLSHPKWWSQDQEFARRNGVPFRIYTAAPGTAARAIQEAFYDYGNVSLPQTIVYVGRDQEPVYKQTGGSNWDTPKWQEEMRRYARGAG
jgi:hypothetical protein